MKTEKAYFGGGCFWCLDAAFSRLKGVGLVMAGYAGGEKADPTYEQVCGGKTGHAEVVEVSFDPVVISYETLLELFFLLHDPTTPNRQGNDVGTQYRSVILYADEKQREMAKKILEKIEKEGLYANPIVTEIVKLDAFYPAEQYHQKYFEKNPDAAYCQLVIEPKLSKFRKKFAEYYR
jgi:peptide-methionine (S)-S-oxide reductase